MPALDPAEVEEVILGCGQPHGVQGHNIARVAALGAGLPVTTAGLTVNRFCASGLQAIVQAAHMIVHEGADAVIGGGVESISLITRDNSPSPAVKDRYPGVYMVMGETAEVVARRYGDHARRAGRVRARSASSGPRVRRPDGFFAGELAPIQVTRAILDKKSGEKIGEEPALVDRDECNRADTTLEGLRKLPPVFDAASGQGSVTAGNSSQLSDGASATLVMSADRAKALGVTPALVVRGYAVSGCAPDEMGIGPVFAVPKLLKHAGLRVSDIDVWELNEAFASQVLYCRDTLGHPDGPAESERRLDRDRASIRDDRLAAGRDDRQRDGAPQGSLRRRDDVRRRRTGRGGAVRTSQLSGADDAAKAVAEWPTGANDTWLILPAASSGTN